MKRVLTCFCAGIVLESNFDGSGGHVKLAQAFKFKERYR